MKYSIITINYNNRDGLRRTIESVVNQTFRDFEYIIIDGGSTDGSVEVIKEYADRIDYWASEPDKGIYNAMNKGILQAHGEYLNFMNSGDCFYDMERLEVVNKYKCAEDFIVGKDLHVDETTNDFFLSILPHIPNSLYLFSSTFPHQSAFIKRNLFKKSTYDESYKMVSDWKFYAEKIVYEGSSIKLLNEVICKREPRGVTSMESGKVQDERTKIKQILFPKGIYDDYNILCQLDTISLDRLLFLLKKSMYRKFLVCIVKCLYYVEITIVKILNGNESNM